VQRGIIEYNLLQLWTLNRGFESVLLQQYSKKGSYRILSLKSVNCNINIITLLNLIYILLLYLLK